MGGLFKATRRERRHAIPPPPPLGRPLFNRLAVWSFILSLYPIATPYVPIILGFVARSQMKERPAMGLRNEEVAWQSPRSLLVSSGRLCSSCGSYSCPWERKGGRDHEGPTPRKSGFDIENRPLSGSTLYSSGNAHCEREWAMVRRSVLSDHERGERQVRGSEDPIHPVSSKLWLGCGAQIALASEILSAR